MVSDGPLYQADLKMQKPVSLEQNAKTLFSVKIQKPHGKQSPRTTIRGHFHALPGLKLIEFSKILPRKTGTALAWPRVLRPRSGRLRASVGGLVPGCPCAASLARGKKAVCSRPSAPSAPASARRPWPPVRGPLAAARRRSGASPAACGGTASPCRFPPRLAGSACRRLRSPAPPPPRPAPLRRAAAPPAGGPGAVPRRSPWVPLVAVAPLRGPWRAPCALLRLPPAPGAAPGGGAPWRGPSASLRASGSGAPAPGPWSGAGPLGPLGLRSRAGGLGLGFRRLRAAGAGTIKGHDPARSPAWFSPPYCRAWSRSLSR